MRETSLPVGESKDHVARRGSISDRAVAEAFRGGERGDGGEGTAPFGKFIGILKLYITGRTRDPAASVGNARAAAWSLRGRCEMSERVRARRTSFLASCSLSSLTFHCVSFVPFDARKINYGHVASSVYLTACNRMYATKCIARVISSGRADAALIN